MGDKVSLSWAERSRVLKLSGNGNECKPLATGWKMYSLHDGGKTPTVSTRAPMVKVFGRGLTLSICS